MTLPQSRSNTFLVGAGIVGQAILQEHIKACKSVWLVDVDLGAIMAAVDLLKLDKQHWTVGTPTRLNERLSAVEILYPTSPAPQSPTIVIESIAERLEIKRSFFAEAEHLFGADAVLCSNTSTLRIDDIGSGLTRPENFAGMHYFMPVDRRFAVEAVRGTRTSERVMQCIRQHIHELNKQPLVVNDGPGFVVNRLLSPYLNEAMLMLGRGIDADRIEQAARGYGMPMSPLELIDWIGTRTTFDAGRVFWQAFPQRIDPSPIAPAMLKLKRLGRSNGRGFYDYHAGRRSQSVSPAAIELADRYCREKSELSDSEVQQVLAIPMWIEAVLAAQDGIVQTIDDFEIAMKGGLGFEPHRSWLECFDAIGSRAILDLSQRWNERTASLRIPEEIRNRLAEQTPQQVLSQAIERN